jgi:hypothetical protein
MHIYPYVRTTPLSHSLTANEISKFITVRKAVLKSPMGSNREENVLHIEEILTEQRWVLRTAECQSQSSSSNYNRLLLHPDLNDLFDIISPSLISYHFLR